MAEGLDVLEDRVDAQIFRPTALRRFLSETLAEIDPNYSIQKNSIDYYTMGF